MHLHLSGFANVSVCLDIKVNQGVRVELNVEIILLIVNKAMGYVMLEYLSLSHEWTFLGNPYHITFETF